jgi:hypothetical protein
MGFARLSRTDRAIARVCALLATCALVPMALSDVAYASTSLTVKVGSGGSYTAKTARVILTIKGVSWECSTSRSTPASHITGTIPSGTHKGRSPVKVGAIETLAFHSCYGYLGATSVKADNLEYALRVDSLTNSQGQTDLIVSGIDLSLSMTGCKFNVSGSAAAYYVNGTQSLELTPSPPITPLDRAGLVISDVSGCAELPSNGDHMTITSAYPLSIPVKINST